MKKLFLPVVAAMALLGAANAQPPGHAKGDTQPPGLQKNGHVPPGQAKKRFAKGEYMPVQYRGDFVKDYRKYGLTKAPRDYRWVRIDGDAYLINVTSGLITEALIGALS